MITADKLERLQEVTYASGATVDREAGIIRGVKICGRESKNGRTYSESALSGARKMYEGIGVNLNHPDRKSNSVERSVEDGFGWLEGVTLKADGLYGDLHFFKSDPFAAKLCEAAERRPDRFGLSHVAEGKTSRQGTKTVVESIVNVHSVDVVQNPATNAGLFESQEIPAMLTKTVKQLIEGTAKKERVEPCLKILREMEGDMPAMTTEVAPEMSADEQANEAFKAMVVAVLDDTSLDVAGKKAKIGEILKAQEKLMSADAPAPESPAPAGDEPKEEKTEESVKHKRAIATELLEAASIKVEPAKVNALASLTDPAERKSLIESWKPSQKQEVRKPARSLGILRESTGNENLSYDELKKQLV